jgi:hypothetical protein
MVGERQALRVDLLALPRSEPGEVSIEAGEVDDPVPERLDPRVEV